jgi:hypothetical protein
VDFGGEADDAGGAGGESGGGAGQDGTAGGSGASADGADGQTGGGAQAGGDAQAGRDAQGAGGSGREYEPDGGAQTVTSPSQEGEEGEIDQASEVAVAAAARWAAVIAQSP